MMYRLYKGFRRDPREQGRGSPGNLDSRGRFDRRCSTNDMAVVLIFDPAQAIAIVAPLQRSRCPLGTRGSIERSLLFHPPSKHSKHGPPPYAIVQHARRRTGVDRSHASRVYRYDCRGKRTRSKQRAGCKARVLTKINNSIPGR